MVRFDKTFDPLSNGPAKISVEVEKSKLKEKIDAGLFEVDTSQIRILVVGDSYIHGGGISPEDKFSKQLDRLLAKKELNGLDPVILDISRPSNNTLDNYNYFKYYQKLFEPDYVFWAYHYNDVHKTTLPQEANIDITAPVQGSKKEVGIRAVIKGVYKNIEIVRYISSKLQKELKLKGIVLPMGNFHYLTDKAYDTDSKSWIASQAMLKNVTMSSVQNDFEFILFRMPQFNLMDNTNLFSKVGDALSTFSSEMKTIKYVSGPELFSGKDASEYMLSKYDGHPNSAAHREIALWMAEYVESSRRSKE